MQYSGSGSKMLDYGSWSVTMNYGSGPGLGPIFTFFYQRVKEMLKKTSNFIKFDDFMLFDKTIFSMARWQPLGLILLFYAPQLGYKEFYTLWLLYCWIFCLGFEIQ
jgi:hypothetical protein